MKKFILLLTSLVLILLLCIACQDTKEKVDKLHICYYDDDYLYYEQSYTKDNFELKNYERIGYDFEGWYLDKEFNTLFDINNLDSYFEMKSIIIYAKAGKVMDKFNICNRGLVDDGNTTLNPTFTWDRVKLTDTYNLTIECNGEMLVNVNIDEAKYAVTKHLNTSSTYLLTIKGLNSNYTETLEFTTIDKAYEEVTINVANPFMSNMVIQRDTSNLITGVINPFELVTIHYEDIYCYGVSDKDGIFNITIPSHIASFNPVNIQITNGINQVKKLENVLFGDVYLFAGQSNMQWPTKDSDFIPKDVDNAKASNVRFFCQDVVTSTTKLEETKNSRWFSITDNNYQYFSAIAFMSGSILSNALNSEVPIGILTAYQGDTNIANWMGEEYYVGNCSTKYLHYNAMVYPLRHTKLSGVVWYQGCNNSAAGGDYEELLLKLFTNYRDLFNSKDVPFYVIGLACYDGDSGNNYDFSYVRESQAKACDKDDNAYFISSCDNGDPTYIHPSTKRYICERVAKSILSSIYNKNYYAEGPSYKDHKVDGSKVTINLNNSEGLHSNGEINNLYLAGEDGKYYLAKASIEGNAIVAQSSKVPNPVYIKYGFGKSPFVNIFNKDNYSLVPFRTDDRNTNIDLLEYNDINKYTFHPDGSKMDIKYNNGNLHITKQNDGKGYGSVRLDYYGMIAYNPEGFKFTIVGTNSNAAISFRIIEGSYEIWAYKIIDNFAGELSFTANIGDFNCVYNKQDNRIDTQKVNYIEIMVESNSKAEFELKEARFVNIEKTAPLTFNISNVSETTDSINIAASKALFADSYKLVVSSTGVTPLNILKEQTNTEPTFTISKEGLVPNIPYYIFITATNDLGSTTSANDGYVFYLKDDSRVIICNFDFTNQQALDAYIQSSMDIHAGLTPTLMENGIKIASAGQGWQQFIFKIDTSISKDTTKLEFKADFSNYKGQVVMQLADTSWGVYSYTLDLSTKKDGTFVLDYSNFLNGTKPFTTQNLMWIMFNFNDTIGNGYILLDDVAIVK